jgi:hypothetical protein
MSAIPASHYMVGTDGRHLFSANSFTLHNTGGSSVLLEGATTKGPEIKIRLNREYLIKAFVQPLRGDAR